MKKKTIIVFGLAAVLMTAPVSQPFCMTVNASEGDTVDVTNDSEAGNGNGEAESGNLTVPEVEDEPTEQTGKKIALATPTGLAWNGNWWLGWDIVPEAEGQYAFELYKDDEIYKSTNYAGLMGAPGAQNLNMSYNQYITENGSYKFRVKAVASYDSETYEDSEWSEFSESRIYVRPNEELGATIGFWSETVVGQFCFAGVEGASGYFLELYYTGSDGEYNAGSAHVNGGKDEEIISYDFSSWIEARGEGRYRVTVTALSGEIDEIANKTGEFSDYLDTRETSKNVSEVIDEAIKNASTKEEALQILTSQIEPSALRTAMQTDDTVLSQIRELEADYASEKGIAVNEPFVSKEASAYVDAKNISVVGVGLNADSGNVRLEVSVPEKKVDISGKNYANSVQLDIRLINNDVPVHVLQVPVTVTLPIPNGMDVSRLVIIHYYENGGIETVNLKNNGDGTITFTVDRFSTFVFAEEQKGENITDDKVTSDNTNKDNTQANSSVDGEEQKKDDVPKTGNLLPGTILLTASICVMAFITTAVLSKKKRIN